MAGLVSSLLLVPASASSPRTVLGTCQLDSSSSSEARLLAALPGRSPGRRISCRRRPGEAFRRSAGSGGRSSSASEADDSDDEEPAEEKCEHRE